MTMKDFYKIMNVTGKKTPMVIEFRDGRHTTLEFYESVSWIAADRDVKTIIDAETGEIVFMR